MQEFREAQLLGQCLCDASVFLRALRELLQLILQARWRTPQKEVAFGSAHDQEVLQPCGPREHDIQVQPPGHSSRL